VFIVGSPRSGTTLLRRIMNRHPALAVCEETRFFEEVYARRSAFGSLEKLKNRERLAQELLLTARIRLLGTDLERLHGHLVEEGTSFANVFRCILEFYANSQGKPRCGDKTPVHSYFTETLSEWYPGAPIIHLIRDPRDVVASLEKMPWGPRSMINSTLFWVFFNRAAERSRHRPEYLQVYYEQLVDDPQRELERICAHIGEDYSDALLTADSSEPYSWPRGASGAVTRERQGKWRKELTPEDVSVVEWITGARLEAHGYARTAAPPSLSLKTRSIVQSARDLARRRLQRLPHWWLCLRQPANLSAQEYCRFRHNWEREFSGLPPLHLRRP
jgi:hypothetical protein